MRSSLSSHISKKLASARVLIGASLLVLSPVLGWAQTYTTSQNFEPNNGGGNYKFIIANPTISTAKFFEGSSDNNDFPKASPQYVINNPLEAPGHSFGIENNAASNNVAVAQLNFRNVQLTNKSTTNTSLIFRFAAFTTTNNGGLDNTGSLVVSINPDSANAPNYYQDVVTVRGSANNSGTYWSFNNNAGVVPAVGSYDNPQVYTANSQINTHYTEIRVNLSASFLSQAKVRITLNASPKTRLLIDDVRITSNSPLPVELVRFTAEAQEKNVALHWITASEKNSDYFEVQRSTNGETFAAIGKVQGEGTTSSISNYLFTDRAPVAGLAYYRLRQVDLDGTESYSPVQAVEWKGGAAVASFYPNPSAEAITFTGTEGMLHYRIYNVKGQQVAIGEVASGSTVDLRAVPAGMYLLELSNKGQRSVQRFVRL
jgi:hypothetical protein